MTKRRNHKPEFKAKVALAAIRGDRTMAELAEQYGLHPNQIQQWKSKLLKEAAEVFGSGEKRKVSSEKEIEKLHSKIGQLTVENDFLSKAVGR